MSAKNRGRADSPGDFHETPLLCAMACVMAMAPVLLGVEKILEPSAGTGVWLEALNVRAKVDGIMAERHACELYPDRYQPKLGQRLRRGTLHTGSFFDLLHPKRYDAVVGNPPYNLATEFIRHAMYTLKPGGHCGYLLRTGFPHTKSRRDLMRKCGPFIEVGLEERPSFDDAGNDSRDGGTDASEYSFFIFKRGYHGPSHKLMLSWKDLAQRELDLPPIWALFAPAQ